MKTFEAVSFVKTLLKERPKYIVGGSLALILQDSIEEREINDFDFVVNVPDLDLSDEEAVNDVFGKTMLQAHDYPTHKEKDYICYKIHTDKRARKRFGDEFYYNIFLRNETSFHEQEIDGVIMKIQDVEEILQYKRLWLRSKDIHDLESLK